MEFPWLLAQVVVCAALAGLCWTVQLAIYPLFERVLVSGGPDGFRAYHAAYTRGLGWVAGPLMLAELLLAAAMLTHAPSGPLAWVGAALVACVWLLTCGVFVPAHRRLQTHPDAAAMRRLVRLNGWRTAAWTVRTILLATARVVLAP